MHCSNPPGLLKRKRKSDDDVSNIENKHSTEDKRLKENATSTEERLPLSELSVLQIASGHDKDKNKIGEFLSDIESDLTDPPAHLKLLSDEILDQPSCSFDVKAKSIKLVGNSRESPIPCLKWTEPNTLWSMFLTFDQRSEEMRKDSYFVNHPTIQPRMRSVLLDWIIEVAEVYKLHKETYYLCLDYLDRFLSSKEGVVKGQLQLIGVTCLLIASKYEEIYPPKVNEFAYVTDGSCSEEDITQMELEILKVLNWECTAMTPVSWLSIYLQTTYKEYRRNGQDLVFPQYPVKMFSRIVQLLDLAMLDHRCLNYSYSVIAATCFYLAGSKPSALTASGLKLSDIQDCIQWMEPFWEVIQEESHETSSTLTPPSKTSPLEFTHMLQVHNVSLDLLESAQNSLQLRSVKNDLQNMLTPPSSSKKSCRKKREESRSRLK